MHDMNKNLKLGNDNILVIKHTLFRISFTLENDNIIYGEYIHCQCERGVIQTKIVSICFTKGYVHVYRIAYFPFHSVFRSVPLSVPRFIEIFTLRKHYLHQIHLRFYRGDNVKTPMLSSHSGNIYMIIVTLRKIL